jgi:hypothetical protein
VRVRAEDVAAGRQLCPIAWLAGALLAVHGPSGAPQDDRPPLTLAPQAPPAPEPTGTAPLPERTPTPAKESGKPARPGNAAPATKITLRCGTSSRTGVQEPVRPNHFVDTLTRSERECRKCFDRNT